MDVAHAFCCAPKNVQRSKQYKKAYGKKARQAEAVVMDQPSSSGGGSKQPQGPFIKRVTDDARGR